MATRRGATLGRTIGGMLGLLAGASIGGTLGGPVGSIRGELGAFLGFLIGLGLGLFLGYWVGAGFGGIFTRARSRSKARAKARAGSTPPPEVARIPKSKTLVGRAWALIGLGCGLLLLFSIVVLPALVLAAVGIGLALQPTETVGWGARLFGALFAAVCLFYLGILGSVILRQNRPRRATGKEPVLLEAATAQGPGTLIITTSTVSILRRPRPGNFAPSIEIVPRTAIVSATSETPLGFPLFSFFGVLTDVLLQTNDGKRYSIEGVSIWQARKVVRLLS